MKFSEWITQYAWQCLIPVKCILSEAIQPFEIKTTQPCYFMIPKYNYICNYLHTVVSYYSDLLDEPCLNPLTIPDTDSFLLVSSSYYYLEYKCHLLEAEGIPVPWQYPIGVVLDLLTMHIITLAIKLANEQQSSAAISILKKLIMSKELPSLYTGDLTFVLHRLDKADISNSNSPIFGTNTIDRSHNISPISLAHIEEQSKLLLNNQIKTSLAYLTKGSVTNLSHIPSELLECYYQALANSDARLFYQSLKQILYYSKIYNQQVHEYLLASNTMSGIANSMNNLNMPNG